MNHSEQKEICRKCLAEDALPIFFQPWWLDVVCQKGEWGVCLSRDATGKIDGVLPYYLVDFLGFKMIRMPPLTPFLGVWVNMDHHSVGQNDLISWEQNVLKELVCQLPKTIWYHQIHPVSLKNCLPFYWGGFKNAVRYTYLLEAGQPATALKNMSSSRRKNIRTAARSLKVTASNDVQQALELIAKSFLHQKEKWRLDRLLFTYLLNEAINREQGLILMAVDNETSIPVATQIVLWDAQAIYLWFHGLDRGHARQKGASSLLIWEVIKMSCQKKLPINFCGSMLPGVANFNASFGAKRKPVYQIYKCSNRLLYAIRAFLG